MYCSSTRPQGKGMLQKQEKYPNNTGKDMMEQWNTVQSL